MKTKVLIFLFVTLLFQFCATENSNYKTWVNYYKVKVKETYTPKEYMFVHHDEYNGNNFILE